MSFELRCEERLNPFASDILDALSKAKLVLKG